MKKIIIAGAGKSGQVDAITYGGDSNLFRHGGDRSSSAVASAKEDRVQLPIKQPMTKIR